VAGAMAGVMHAPLTAISLIAEITGGYDLLIPLIITSTIAYITVRSFERYSIYHVQLAERGELITHDVDKAVLTLMDWKNEIETVMDTFRETGAWNQPVLDNGYYVRFVSKSKIYTTYRELLIQVSEE
jgi:hypothetical protein